MVVEKPGCIYLYRCRDEKVSRFDEQTISIRRNYITWMDHVSFVGRLRAPKGLRDDREGLAFRRPTTATLHYLHAAHHAICRAAGASQTNPDPSPIFLDREKSSGAIKLCLPRCVVRLHHTGSPCKRPDETNDDQLAAGVYHFICIGSRLVYLKPFSSTQKLKKNSKFLITSKFAAHAWSIKYRRKQKLIIHFACKSRDESFESS